VYCGLQVVKAVEVLVSVLPATPGLVRLLLRLRPCFPGDGPLFWLLPLLIRALFASQPVAPAADWVEVVGLARGVSAGSAAAVARRGSEVHPWSRQLWQLHQETAGEGGKVHDGLGWLASDGSLGGVCFMLCCLPGAAYMHFCLLQ
jgi:hypothetical protein